MDERTHEHTVTNLTQNLNCYSLDTRYFSFAFHFIHDVSEWMYPV